MPNKLTFEYVKQFINKEQTLISTEYTNNKSLLKIQCNICKQIYNQNFDRYKNGHRHQKCTCNKFSNSKGDCLNGGIASARKRYGDIFLKETIRICKWCKKKYNPKRSQQKFCSRKCATTCLVSNKEKLQVNGLKGGVASAASQQRRSKNEIYLSKLYIAYFGENDIQCNEPIFKDANNNLWDCDIYIKSLKMAILWDGWYWHYRPDVSNKQIKRDRLKRKIILQNGCNYYTIIDKGKFNKYFVEEQFYLFLHKLNFKKVSNELVG